MRVSGGRIELAPIVELLRDVSTLNCVSRHLGRSWVLSLRVEMSFKLAVSREQSAEGGLHSPIVGTGDRVVYAQAFSIYSWIEGHTVLL